MTNKVAVIGAGIVGLCIACRLQDQDYDTILLDPSGMESSASYGNAGSLSPASIIPMSMPGMLRQVPRLLFARESPLSVRWRHLPAFTCWAGHFARACTPREAQRIAGALIPLLAEAPAQFREILGARATSHLIQQKGSLTVFRSLTDWNDAEPGLELRRRNGITFHEIPGSELADLDPSLRTDLFRGVFFPQNGQCVDLPDLLTHLMRRFLAAGGQFESLRVTQLVFSGDRLSGLQTARSSHPILVGKAIIAAGTGSVPLTRQVGERVPVASEFGYHVMLNDSGCAPRLPTMDAAGKFVVSSMSQGVRISGVAEFASSSSRPRWTYAKRLLKQARRLYPELGSDDTVTTQFWRGARPSTPDSLPVIGLSRRSTDVLLAFGHGHLGLTAAPMTARIIGDLLSGRRPDIDIVPYAPQRF